MSVETVTEPVNYWKAAGSMGLAALFGVVAYSPDITGATGNPLSVKIVYGIVGALSLATGIERLVPGARVMQVERTSISE